MSQFLEGTAGRASSACCLWCANTWCYETVEWLLLQVLVLASCHRQPHWGPSWLQCFLCYKMCISNTKYEVFNIIIILSVSHLTNCFICVYPHFYRLCYLLCFSITDLIVGILLID